MTTPAFESRSTQTLLGEGAIMVCGLLGIGAVLVVGGLVGLVLALWRMS